MLYQDIPRIYTAIAEWGACLVYLYILKKENMKSVHFLTGSLFMLAMQSIFLILIRKSNCGKRRVCLVRINSINRNIK